MNIDDITAQTLDAYIEAQCHDGLAWNGRRVPIAIWQSGEDCRAAVPEDYGYINGEFYWLDPKLPKNGTETIWVDVLPLHEMYQDEIKCDADGNDLVRDAEGNYHQMDRRQMVHYINENWQEPPFQSEWLNDLKRHIERHDLRFA